MFRKYEIVLDGQKRVLYNSYQLKGLFRGVVGKSDSVTFLGQLMAVQTRHFDLLIHKLE